MLSDFTRIRNKVTACSSKKEISISLQKNRDTGCKEIKSVTPRILALRKKKKNPKNMNSSQIPRGKIDAETLQCPKHVTWLRWMLMRSTHITKSLEPKMK